MELRKNLPVILATLVAAAIIFVAVRFKAGPIERIVRHTVGEVQAVHADVKVRDANVHGMTRFAKGDPVETSNDGRGRVRLDDGTTIVLDRSTRLTVDESTVKLERGRLFVMGVPGGKAQIDAAGAVAVVSDGVVAVTRADAGGSFYCASGEIVVRKGDAEKRVRSGETAQVGAQGVAVAPEKAFNDWTGGMATPWSVSGKPRATIGELWGRMSNMAAGEDGGSPLAIRQHRVEARIEGEVALTEVSTTYFNAGNGTVTGDFRMAIPPGGIVSRFAVQAQGTTTDGRIAVGRDDASFDPPRLEWAGDGWVRGQTSPIEAGGTVTVVVSYIEWLSPSGGHLSYRYPMVSDGNAPLIGEFRARVDTTGANPRAIHAAQGATVSGTLVEMTRADYRPTSDLVVELDLPPNALGSARGYVAKAPVDDNSGQYLLVRTEVPQAKTGSGVSLVLVVDTSLSVDPALLDAERAFVEAVLEGLGANDKVVVLAADQLVTPVGPDALGAVTPERRKQTREALGTLRSGGATDLGLALEKGADMLPKDAASAMVIYVGDGWPTIGDVAVESIRARLSRRSGGVPRLGAVAVGPMANRFGLTAMVRGSGPIFDIADRADAAEIAVHLLAEALKPAIADVDLDLGPSVERVYPRGARTVLAGSTVFAVGRVRDQLPRSVKVRFREGEKATEETRLLHMPPVVDVHDIRRRWGAARVEELALRGEGKEAAIDVALKVGLLTPWTAWVLGGGSLVYKPQPIEARVLDLSAMQGAPLSARIATRSDVYGTLVGPPSEPEDDPKDDEAEYKRAIEQAARRTLEEAMPAVRACRDSRAALRPEITGNLRVRVTVDGDGKTTKAQVRASATPDDDLALDRCVEVVVQNLVFFSSGLRTEIVIEHELRLPPPRKVRGQSCSKTATLPLPVRRGVWRERLRRESKNAAQLYLAARGSCELPTWTDRRSMLELMLDTLTSGTERVSLARQLDDAGDADAAALLRKEAIRRASTPEELQAVRIALLGDEKKAVGTFRKTYRDAKGDEARLEVVRKFLKLAPHDSVLRRRLFALLESLGKKDQLREEILRVRQDPFADAALLCDGASALLRLGDQAEARRAFGELIERAPNDPYARAYVGDRLRNEGLFEDATGAYDALSSLIPGDPAATLRLSLAHAGAGRLDVASRILHRVAQTGGRMSSEALGELASIVDAVLNGLARAETSRPEDERARLLRRAYDIALPDASALVLVRTPSLDLPLSLKLVRGEGKNEQEARADVATPSIGLYSVRIERGDRDVKLRLRLPRELEPFKPRKVRIDVYVRGEDPARSKIVSKELDIANDGKPVDIRYVDGALN